MTPLARRLELGIWNLGFGIWDLPSAPECQDRGRSDEQGGGFRWFPLRRHHRDEREDRARQDTQHILFAFEGRIAGLEEANHEKAEYEPSNSTRGNGCESSTFVVRSFRKRRRSQDLKLLAHPRSLEIGGDL
jgi:hypothetical protein